MKIDTPKRTYKKNWSNFALSTTMLALLSTSVMAMENPEHTDTIHLKKNSREKDVKSLSLKELVGIWREEQYKSPEEFKQWVNLLSEDQITELNKEVRGNAVSNKDMFNNSSYLENRSKEIANKQGTQGENNPVKKDVKSLSLNELVDMWRDEKNKSPEEFKQWVNLLSEDQIIKLDKEVESFAFSGKDMFNNSEYLENRSEEIANKQGTQGENNPVKKDVKSLSFKELLVIWHDERKKSPEEFKQWVNLLSEDQIIELDKKVENFAFVDGNSLTNAGHLVDRSNEILKNKKN